MSEHTHRELILQGENLFEQGAYLDALDLFGRVLEEDPDNVHALNDAGITAGELDHTRQAVEYFERALAAQPDFEPAFFGLLDVLTEAEKAEAAVHAFLRYEEHIPNTEEKQRYADVLTQLTAPETPHAEQIRRAEELLMQDQPGEALAVLHDVLEQDPHNAHALNDAGHAYVDLGEAVEASRCFEQALETDPGHQSAFYSLIDLLVRAESPELAVDVFVKYHEHMPDDEEKGKYAEALGGWADDQTANAGSGDSLPGEAHLSVTSFPEPASSEGLRIAIVCGPDRKFITGIEEGLRQKGHAVHTCYFDDKIDLQRIQQAMDWADVTWFEWCDQVLVHASQQLRKTSQVACRLHSYEAFTDMPRQVNWGFVDTTVFVALHIEQIFREQFDAGVETTVIYNGVDLDRMRFKEREPSYNLAYVGYVNHKKNPELLLQCMADLVRRDDRYVLHIAGTFQELRYKLYFDKMIPAMGLDGNVVLHGWVDDIDSWLEDKSYLVSTSVLESFGMGIAEAMAKGIKPVIHNWVGAEHIYPQELLFNTSPEFSEQVLADDYDSSAYRAYIATHYSAPDQHATIEALFRRICSKATPMSEAAVSPKSPRRKPGATDFSSSSYWDQRYAQGGNSGSGSYGRLARFKAEVVNAFVRDRDVASLIDFGCGDGNQLGLASYPAYIGLDVSPNAIARCRQQFGGDPGKQFALYEPDAFDEAAPPHTADLALSMDVIFHLIEDEVFERYMRHLFASAQRYVIVYANNTDQNPANLSKHVRYRRFTDWVEANAQDWQLIQRIPNRYPLRHNPESESVSDFYIFEKAPQDVVVDAPASSTDASRTLIATGVPHSALTSTPPGNSAV